MICSLISGLRMAHKSVYKMTLRGFDYMVSSMCRYLRGTALSALVALVIVGCSDGGGGGGIGGTGKQITQDGLIFGVVDGFGSIILNNQRFDTDAAQITIDNKEATLADLSIGMSLSATVDTIAKAAIKLQYQPNVSGPVQSIDQSSKSLMVLGQTVLFPDATMFDALMQSGLRVGQLIEVSGSRDGAQNIVATYTAEAPADQDTYVVGVVETDTNTGDLRISNATLNTQIAAATEGLSVAEFESQYLVPGTSVRVQTTAAAAANAATVEEFTLSVIKVADIESLAYKAGDSIQIIGIMSTSTDDGALIIKGLEVSTDGETEATNSFGVPIEFPLDPQNRAVLVNGIADADNGVVLMSSVKFLDEN